MKRSAAYRYFVARSVAAQVRKPAVNRSPLFKSAARDTYFIIIGAAARDGISAVNGGLLFKNSARYIDFVIVCFAAVRVSAVYIGRQVKISAFYRYAIAYGLLVSSGAEYRGLAVIALNEIRPLSLRYFFELFCLL